jgi:23S rRNA pseudouridine955/2504/2580 synthase
MRALTAGTNDAGRRIDRFLKSVYPHLPISLLQRWIREKRIRLRGVHPHPSDRVELGDEVRLYVSDDALRRPDDTKMYLQIHQPKLDIHYEDEHFILLSKPAGISVHSDEHDSVHTLINHVQAYLFQSGQWRPDAENSFAPALCHRLDRNTSGLIIAAKTAPALRMLHTKFASGEIQKFYICRVLGHVAPQTGELTHFLRRDTKRKMVTVHDNPLPGGRTASLRYRVLEKHSGTSLLEVQLLTGRTHQIRAQLAYIGHPLLGDGKYGTDNSRRGQALCAFKLAFAFTSPSPPLDYINGRVFTLPLPEWANSKNFS